MPTTDGDTIRETFLRFFERHDHRRINGASVVPVNDPTLLFINSGMAPLKKYFTGEMTPPAPDLCDVQGCVRTKDIDDVGDRHHITYFEMLGSWSIGNYFKDRAVELAFELLTGDLGLDPRRLYVTVFGGDERLGLPADEESALAWERVGIGRDRIVGLPAEDNFWGPAGESGPCGPCTEVFLDTGEEFGPAYVPGGEFDTKRRYIEIWNAGVFMQFDKGLDGVLRPLPFTSVDTGSGLERMELALNGLDSVYDTSLFVPLVRSVQDVLGESGEVLHHHRVIADHLRAAVAIMSDGVRPGNEGRGYIPRRLIRKCVTMAMGRHQERFDFEPIVEAVVGSLGPTYPHFAVSQSAVMAAIAQERDEFGVTVRRGLDRLDKVIAQHGMVSGADAFHLFATYGLPVEITRDLAAAQGVTLDREEFDAALRRHRVLSRGAAPDGSDRRLRVNDVLPVAVRGRTEFLGYDTLTCEATILTLFAGGTTVDEAAVGTEADMIVDRTPFYGEGGGQIGDRGVVRGPGAGDITETVVHDSGGFLHRVSVRSGVLRVGDVVALTVDPSSRAQTAANHTATHLLNAALRSVLGPHVRQAGSLVEPQRLRFDFTHPRALTAGELTAVERLVNEWVLTDAHRDVEVMTPDEAKASGAISLEGEDYGEAVRVLSFGDFSKELCGGTHVEHTSQIGSFRIVSEQSIASGVRRIVAVTRQRAVEYTLGQASSLSEVVATLRTSHKDVVPAARRLVEAAKTPKPSAAATVAGAHETVVNDVPVMLAAADGAVGGLREEARREAAERGRVVLLWNATDEKKTLVVSVPKTLSGRLRADEVLKTATDRLGGGGGGNATIAQGGLTSAPTRESLIEVLTAAVPGRAT